MQEKRQIQVNDIQYRALEDGKDIIEGTGTVFDKRSEYLGWFYEEIDPKALEDVDLTDVVGQYNHEVVLGRTSANTMQVEVTSSGLIYRIYPSEATDNRDAVIKIKRGDVRGSSFIFTVAPRGEEWYDDNGMTVRRITKIGRYYETGPVAFPAYKDTDTSYAKRSFDQFQQEQEKIITHVEGNVSAALAKDLRFAKRKLQLLGKQIF